jgi:hypothetical protein
MIFFRKAPKDYAGFLLDEKKDKKGIQDYPHDSRRTQDLKVRYAHAKNNSSKILIRFGLDLEVKSTLVPLQPFPT